MPCNGKKNKGKKRMSSRNGSVTNVFDGELF